MREGANARQIEFAVGALANLAVVGDSRRAIADAGAIEPLVALLQSKGATTETHMLAAVCLGNLAALSPCQAQIAAAGGIPPLIALAGGGGPGGNEQSAQGTADETDAAGAAVSEADDETMEQARAGAVGCLWNLAVDDANKHAIVAAGGVAVLLRFLGGAAPLAREQAAGARVRRAAVLLRTSFLRPPLCSTPSFLHALPTDPPLPFPRHTHASGRPLNPRTGALANLTALAATRTAVVDAGGVPPLVSLLCEGTTALQRQFAATAVKNIALCEAYKFSIAHAGGIEALVALARDGSSAAQREQAACALCRCADLNWEGAPIGREPRLGGRSSARLRCDRPPDRVT